MSIVLVVCKISNSVTWVVIGCHCDVIVICYYIFVIRAVVFIAHGVGEHSGRYESLATLLNEHKYAVYSHDYG